MPVLVIVIVMKLTGYNDRHNDDYDFSDYCYNHCYNHFGSDKTRFMCNDFIPRQLLWRIWVS